MYGNILRPSTKQAEAVGAWITSMERDIVGGAFHREAELREAVHAAAEEVEAATRSTPAAQRLRDALLGDAMRAIETPIQRPSNTLPWAMVGIFGGILIGILLTRNRR